MFGNLGFSEMLVIFAVAMLVFGPQRLPEIARSVGRALGHFRRTANDIRNTVEREVRGSELGTTLEEARSLARQADPRVTKASAATAAQPRVADPGGPDAAAMPVLPDIAVTAIDGPHETEPTTVENDTRPV